MMNKTLKLKGIGLMMVIFMLIVPGMASGAIHGSQPTMKNADADVITLGIDDAIVESVAMINHVVGEENLNIIVTQSVSEFLSVLSTTDNDDVFIVAHGDEEGIASPYGEFVRWETISQNMKDNNYYFVSCDSQTIEEINSNAFGFTGDIDALVGAVIAVNDFVKNNKFALNSQEIAQDVMQIGMSITFWERLINPQNLLERNRYELTNLYREMPVISVGDTWFMSSWSKVDLKTETSYDNWLGYMKDGRYYLMVTQPSGEDAYAAVWNSWGDIAYWLIDAFYDSSPDSSWYNLLSNYSDKGTNNLLRASVIMALIQLVLYFTIDAITGQIADMIGIHSELLSYAIDAIVEDIRDALESIQDMYNNFSPEANSFIDDVEHALDTFLTYSTFLGYKGYAILAAVMGYLLNLSADSLSDVDNDFEVLREDDSSGGGGGGGSDTLLVV